MFMTFYFGGKDALNLWLSSQMAFSDDSFYMIHFVVHIHSLCISLSPINNSFYLQLFRIVALVNKRVKSIQNNQLTTITFNYRL